MLSFIVHARVAESYPFSLKRELKKPYAIASVLAFYKKKPSSSYHGEFSQDIDNETKIPGSYQKTQRQDSNMSNIASVASTNVLVFAVKEKKIADVIYPKTKLLVL